jgi:hypothetical protein
MLLLPAKMCCGFHLATPLHGAALAQPSKIATATKLALCVQLHHRLNYTFPFATPSIHLLIVLKCVVGPPPPPPLQEGGSGYRIPLALALSEPPCGGCPMPGGGWNISTMGTLTTGPSYTPVQWHKHEGHPGWTIDMVDKILNKSLETSPIPPDLITIHLGTL